MSLYFYPTTVILPPGHFSKDALDKLPTRFAEKGLKSDWVIRGPFHDEEAGEYQFVIQGGPTKNAQEIFSIKESDFVFDSRASENFISKLVSFCMATEYGSTVMNVLSGKESSLPEERKEPEVVKTFVMHKNKECVETDVKIGAAKEPEKGKIIIASR
jgi:hypothetical protein